MPDFRSEIEKIDNTEYFKFSFQPRFEKALNSLKGILFGILADGRIEGIELSALTGWLQTNSEFRNTDAFSNLFQALDAVVRLPAADNKVLCEIFSQLNKFETNSGCKRFGRDGYYDPVTMRLQELHGILGGIIADNVITEDELLSLRQWMDNNGHLQKCYPFQDVDSLLTDVLADGTIDDAEEQYLLRFFRQFTDLKGGRAIDPRNIKGVCAACPEIEFEGKTFCFSGSSSTHTRKDFQELIESHGGIFHPSVTKDVDFLVIGGAGNKTWSYACFGRKVEKAMLLRQTGHEIQIIHEFDLLDEIQ